MDNKLLQIKIKQRLNKLASFDYDNIECWQIQEAVNKAQLEWTRRMVYGLNSRRQGKEDSAGLIDDLRVLLAIKELKPTMHKGHWEADLPENYLYYVRTETYALTDCCPKRRMTVYEVEESNLGVLLNSHTKAPSFEWAETLATLVGHKLRIYTNDEFTIQDTKLVYYRKPQTVKFAGCMNPSTGTTYTRDVELEFTDDIAEIIVDEAVSILAGDIESISQYQRATQNTDKNS